MKELRANKAFDIVLSRGGVVSLNEQLVTQISLQIVNGILKPGDKLPSVRALARRLNVHHNTISSAYGVLADENLVEVRHGSGVYVSKTSIASSRGNDLDSLIRDFLDVARKQGHALQSIRESVKKWLDKQPPDHLLVIEPAKDLQKILIYELKQHFECEIVAATVEEVIAKQEMLTGALSVSTFYHATEIKRLLPSDALLVPINLQTLQPELVEKLKHLPEGAMVGIVSTGETMLEYARVIMVSLRGEDLLVRTETFESTKKWQALSKIADLIITDSYCFEKISNFAGKKVLSLKLISPQIVRYLGNALKNSFS
ncbi:MAG: GntR family transcriptional regulator [Acidobacteria bacterium]|nr:GntR family transcriptional regulator [Acidobacteriota bacterium]